MSENKNQWREISEELYLGLKSMKGQGMTLEDLDKLLTKYQTIVKEGLIKDSLDSLYKVLCRIVYGEFIIDGNHIVDELKRQCFVAIKKYESLGKDNK